MLVLAGGRAQPARSGDPKRVGPYRIIGRLGSGGMGTVHAGLDPIGLRVAVKVVNAAQAEDPEFRARFRREVQLSAHVQGPCLVPLQQRSTKDRPGTAAAHAAGAREGITLDVTDLINFDKIVEHSGETLFVQL
ncbi:hypothetical protein [Streptomyces sp. NPDC054797]